MMKAGMSELQPKSDEEPTGSMMEMIHAVLRQKPCACRMQDAKPRTPCEGVRNKTFDVADDRQ
jgi:hypothetical protein